MAFEAVDPPFPQLRRNNSQIKGVPTRRHRFSQGVGGLQVDLEDTIGVPARQVRFDVPNSGPVRIHE